MFFSKLPSAWNQETSREPNFTCC